MRYLILILFLVAFLAGCGREEQPITTQEYCKSVRFVVSPEKINGTKYCRKDQNP